MIKFSHKPEQANTWNKSRALSSLSVLVAFSFLLTLVGGTATGAATIQVPEIRNGSARSAGPGPQFAIADFDGDLHPDLASVQVERSGATTSTYWIRLRLSVSGRQFISLDAPVGGLLIEARDVNGDHAVDLVLATAWTKQPVAIFLNDGHGRFSRVAPSAFPAAFAESHGNWSFVSEQSADAAVVLPQPYPGIYLEETNVPLLRSQAGSNADFWPRFSPIVFLSSHAGRAPPL